MLRHGPAKKVTVYVGEDLHHHDEPLYLALYNFLFYHGVSGATVTKGVAGFGADHHLHTARILEVSENRPIKIEFVDTPQKLDELLPTLLQMVGEGLVEIQDTIILKAATATPRGQMLPRTTLQAKGKMMRIFIGENDRWRGKPLYDAIVESLRAHDIAGVTVYRGISGYGARRRFRKERHLRLSSDRPIMISVIDEEAKIRAYLPWLEQVLQEGIVVLSDADVIKYTHRLKVSVGAEEPS
jgi:PII-like signaling protein